MSGDENVAPQTLRDRISQKTLTRRDYLRLVGAGLVAGTAGVAAVVLRIRSDSSGKWIAAAGDVAANRSSDRVRDTSDLIVDDSLIEHVLVLGDVQYSGSYDLYEATWGRFKDKTFPCPGNHDYGSSGPISLYDDYWGSLAPKQHGRNYVKDLECGWTMFSLDSDVGYEPSLTWLEQELAALPPAQKIIAFWHHPVYQEAGTSVENPNVLPMFDKLLEHRCDLVLYGHKHNYARYPRMGNSGSPAANGPFCILVGTGGIEINTAEVGKGGNVSASAGEWGVLKLFLDPGGFKGRFVDYTGKTLDSFDDGNGGLIPCLR